LVTQGQGFDHPCDWLQLGLFDGHSCAWLAGSGRGDLFILEHDLNSKLIATNADEFRESFDFVGLEANGKVEVYRHKKTGEIRYVGRPFHPSRKWWQFWKSPSQFPVNRSNHDEIFETARNLIKPYVEHQLVEAPLDQSARKQLQRALEMLGRVIEFNPSNWAALWAIGIANKCLRDLPASYTAFQKAYVLEKDNPNVGRELSCICMALGKAEEAVRISREVVNRNPQDAGLISNHALALLIAGSIHEAEIAVESALSLEPEDQITKNLAKFIARVRMNQVPKPDRYPSKL
jgi:tetratricopeptide (TPR) repeat protein